MNILFAVTRNPDPDGRADQFTTYKAIEHLRSLGHTVDVFILKKNSILSLRFLFNCVTGVFHLEPFQLSLFRNNDNDQDFKEILDKKDYQRVYFHLIRGLSLRKWVPKSDLYLGMQLSQGLNFSRISDELPFGIKKILYKIEAKLCAQFEKKVVTSVNKVNFVGYQDPEFLGFSGKHDNFTVIPHGVDTSYVRGDYCGRELIFLANFASEANKSAFYLLVEYIMPLVWLTHPNVKLSVCGLKMPKSFFKKESERIAIKGKVECPLAEISSHKIFLNPVRAAAGMQNKALAGFIAGVPVISFQSAIAGMPLDYPTCFRVDASTNEFAQSICRVLDKYPETEVLNSVKNDVIDQWSWGSLHREWTSDFMNL